MSKKFTPYLFLGLLAVILFFILGVRYGQKVEKTNKVITALISIPPTATVAPTQPPLTFLTYVSKGCGISFTYPNYFKVERESSKSATLRYRNQYMNFSCLNFKKEASPEAHMTILTKSNPKNSVKTVFYLDKSLLPLLEESIKFVTK
ncbi:hypothetical protein A2334_01705 [Candidatus Roizmanbacteria bacterium RIFOXYB2_FULL_38_10]|uniref:Uncharacterized protein n=1 Tax=Candidatus Roizmanbacteria bacterium RIFOXYD1_FULL_38_12 TaxID=1802093 RepID=A0A1F7L1Q2_9BACT|nr:MAG: hypothetical protein A3K47_04765 [Candidatus Roizmanbacteria bacterium RIFOXYA2_FULL_38_14]OGK64062.1 MAG: hypothetical protein A3K27_04765 [Candidatus Roizmanbacteria bacterium RIFOXYA1_FULL_37_12]OGK65908.1 MAG: hypothetical protein A3K38_04765 [Candidatus Roizmanbacteria bacterium RIFOXYB1_FULL_40_23]OGK68061.1 MAG: hypothetical protein A2334_01705 [Candidatus Roizmanbacteria bacterium RIFOXYB2_FULL_38_10]OGK70313.1 MAG: hypothetical protein A3K21_04770 [Candidatus Roizmanbacteria ba